MADHASRAHATWSASASDRLWGCPGSLAMQEGAPPDKESHAAAWGTAAHEVAEWSLRNKKSCGFYPHETVKTKAHEIAVDDEIRDCAEEFVSYVWGRIDEYRNDCDDEPTLLIEQQFSLDKINPPFDAGGMGDAVLLYPKWGLIEIVDLKGGRGIVVEALGNKQLRTYGLGAVLANPGRWNRVKATIVQPRAPHPDGRIRSDEFDIMDLMEWTADLLGAMHKAKGAADGFASHGPGREWADDNLSPGDHCTFCRAKVTCPAVEQKSLEMAHTFFDADKGTATMPPPPETLSMDRIVTILDHADMIQNWLNAVRAYAQDQAESGVPVKNDTSEYILTPKRAMRKWSEAADAEALSLATGRDADEFYAEPKLLSPAQTEKLLGKKAYEAVKCLVTQESSGYNLVRSDKTTKPAALPPAQQFFGKED